MHELPQANRKPRCLEGSAAGPNENSAKGYFIMLIFCAFM